MAKSAPASKKTAKVAKAAVAGKKAKRTRSRKESYGIYIPNVLKIGRASCRDRVYA